MDENEKERERGERKLLRKKNRDIETRRNSLFICRWKYQIARECSVGTKENCRHDVLKRSERG